MGNLKQYSVFTSLVYFVVVIYRARAAYLGESRLVHEWVSVDFEWPSHSEKAEALRTGSYVPERNVLSGIKVYRQDVYATIPRWKWTSGQPVTLAKVVVNQSQTTLRPYPNWAAQKLGDCRALQFVQSMEIDPNTGLMYVIDTGRVGLGGKDGVLNLCPAKIVVYDLNTDTQVDIYEMPDDVVTKNNNFMNDIILDYVNGKVRYAYISDPSETRMHIYDFQTRSAHNLEDPSMKVEGNNASIIDINGKSYTFNSALNGIAMSPGFDYVYYCPLTGYNLYQISTSTLRHVGQTGPSGIRSVGKKISQSGGIIHASQNLYFGALALNAIYYWDAAKDMADQQTDISTVIMKTQKELVRNDRSMQWPDTFALDNDGWLWFMSNRLHLFLKDSMDFTGRDGVNMRVWKVFINETSYLNGADKRTLHN